MKQKRFFSNYLTFSMVAFVSLSFMATANSAGWGQTPDLPRGKQTELGLYLTAAEAHKKWLSAPDKIKVLDVRTLEEYLHVGHAPMAWNIPLMYQTHEWDDDKGNFIQQPNPDFLAQVRQVAGPDEIILVMCRNGNRSAKAIDMMSEAGYKNVYQVTDGMEGDLVKDPLSVYNGQRLRNGWKNSGLPWTYKPDLTKIKLKKTTGQ
jgi:rhodanese-related sulfurtransferase